MEQTEFTFLLKVSYPWGGLHKIAKLTPKGTELVDGDLVYYYSVRRATFVNCLIAAHKKRDQLIAKTGLDWDLDDEASYLKDGQTHYRNL